MPVTESTLKSSNGHSLFLRTWMPAQPVRAVQVLVHGLGEHAGRYPHVVETFTARGYAVFGHDHTGFGRSGGQRGHFDRFSDLVADLDQIVEFARGACPGAPVTMYGHSLGGMIATHYLAAHEDKIAAAVLSAPGYGPGPDLSRSAMVLSRVLARVAPTMTITAGAKTDLQLSHDREVQAAFAEDPLCHTQVTPRFASVGLTKAGEAQTLLAGLTLPVLVLLGTKDSMINSQAIHEAMAGVGPNVILRTYPTHHELHNERADLREPVLRETAAWLDGVLQLA